MRIWQSETFTWAGTLGDWFFLTARQARSCAALLDRWQSGTTLTGDSWQRILDPICTTPSAQLTSLRYLENRG
jgi:hypothetical protein